MKTYSAIVFSCLALHTLSGCVSPPSDLQPSVLSADELELVSGMRRGKEYALSGRYPQAEEEFRKILEVSTPRASVHNDLGYVLLSQNRLTEAAQQFRAALAITPTDISARENLARTLYRAGRLEEAKFEFEDLLEAHSRAELTDASQPDKKTLNSNELAFVHRNLAIINYALGFSGDALCHSAKSLEYNGGMSEIVSYERMLLSLEHVDKAAEFLRALVMRDRAGVSPTIMLDYAVALTSAGDYTLADQALGKLGAASFSSRFDRIAVRLLLATSALREDRRKEADAILETLYGEESDLCEQPLSDIEHYDYLPQKVVEELQAMLGVYCERQHSQVTSNENSHLGKLSSR